MSMHAGARARHVAAAFLLAVSLTAGGCGGCETCDEGVPGGGPPFVQAPDFSLEDLNPNSATFQAMHSPRNYVGAVSAWYFGTAT